MGQNVKDKESYGQEFLYAENLLAKGAYQTVKLKISEAIEPNRLRSANGKHIDKWTLRFEGKAKMLVLCKTNESVLHFVCGGGPAEWVGKEITLAVREVEAFGDQVVAIRVMPVGVKIRKGLVKRLGTPAQLATS
jgi:hypothetical protein